MDCSDSRSEEGQGYDTDDDVKQLLPKRSKKAQSGSSKRYTGAHLYKSISQVKLAEEVVIYQARKENPHCFELTLCIQNAELWSPGREGCPKADTLFTIPKEF